MRYSRVVPLCAIAVAAVSLTAGAQTIAPTSAISFQDEGTLTFNDTAALSTLDGNYGPTMTGTVARNAYATGTNPLWFDGISLSFDLAAAGVNYPDITSASLVFYARNGASGGWGSHSYQLLAGAFNPTNEDGDPTGTFFNLPAGGSLSAPIPLAQFTSNTFDITLRMWEVQIDQVQLVVTVPTPGAAAALGLGGLAATRRRRPA